MKTKEKEIKEIAQKIQSMAVKAARNGGMWVSSAGGTHDLAVYETARILGISPEESAEVLEDLDWAAIDAANPWPRGRGLEWMEGGFRPKFDIRAVVRAALKGA